MSLRTSLILVAITAGVLGLGFVGVVVLGKVAQAMRSAVTSESARQQFVAKWRPPRAFTLDGLLPERLGEFTASNRVSFAQSEALGVGLPGVRGVYGVAQGMEVEVLVLQTEPATEVADREAAVKALQARLEGRGGAKTFWRVNDRCVYSTSTPQERGELWLLPGWLILFKSDREIPLPFVRGYLEAIAEPQPPGI